MTKLLRTADARQRGLGGSDVFLNEHLAYLGGINRTAMCRKVLQHALVVLSDTATLRLRCDLKRERQALQVWAALDGVRTGVPLPSIPVQEWVMQNRLYEQFKIGVGLELIAKAHLLLGGFVVHEIDPKAGGRLYRAIATQQQAQPVPVAELEALGGWFFDGEQNSLAGLRPQSLAFSTILTAGYLDTVHLSPHFANVARIYRPLRNDFHFPLALALPDLIDNPDLDLEAELVVIANQDVVDTANALGRELSTPMPDIERLPA